ncbi:hypothetical protein ACWF95_37925 [Streptomyces vinaceus]
MTANETPQLPLADHIAELTDEDRKEDRRLLWLQSAAVLLVAAMLVVRWLWLV